MENYAVEYNQKYREWQVTNNHHSCSAAGEPYVPEFIYGFPTWTEAKECSDTLRKWHRNSYHPSYRKNKVV